jgi:hypothetical protein
LYVDGNKRPNLQSVYLNILDIHHIGISYIAIADVAGATWMWWAPQLALFLQQPLALY